MRETIDKKVNALSKQEEQRQLREVGNVEEEHRKNGK